MFFYSKAISKTMLTKVEQGKTEDENMARNQNTASKTVVYLHCNSMGNSVPRYFTHQMLPS